MVPEVAEVVPPRGANATSLWFSPWKKVNLPSIVVGNGKNRKYYEEKNETKERKTSKNFSKFIRSEILLKF